MYITIGNFEDKYNISIFKKGLNPVFELDEGVAVEMLKRNLTIIVEDENMEEAIEKLVNNFSNDEEKIIKIYNNENEILEILPYTKIYSINHSLSTIFDRIEIVLGW